MRAVIEMLPGDCLKRELDKATGKLVVDRHLYYSPSYAYGFIENTLAQDGDPLDVFVLQESNSLMRLDVTNIDILGAFLCQDNGVTDEKIMATVRGYRADPVTHGVGKPGQTETFDPKERFFILTEAYLRAYKPGFTVMRRLDKVEALELIEKYKVVDSKVG